MIRLQINCTMDYNVMIVCIIVDNPNMQIPYLIREKSEPFFVYGLNDL